MRMGQDWVRTPRSRDGVTGVPVGKLAFVRSLPV
jgi:hypothetical protein